MYVGLCNNGNREHYTLFHISSTRNCAASAEGARTLKLPAIGNGGFSAETELPDMADIIHKYIQFAYMALHTVMKRKKNQ